MDRDEVLKDTMDAWVKQIRMEVSEYSQLPSLMHEQVENIQHNYELILELKDQIEELKQEVNALTRIQIIHIIGLKNKEQKDVQHENFKAKY